MNSLPNVLVKAKIKHRWFECHILVDDEGKIRKEVVGEDRATDTIRVGTYIHIVSRDLGNRLIHEDDLTVEKLGPTRRKDEPNKRRTKSRSRRPKK